MAHFLDQSQKKYGEFIYGTFSIYGTFLISIFCSILEARPLCSNLHLTSSKKMLKMQGKFCWKLDLDIFPTPLTSYFYHF